MWYSAGWQNTWLLLCNKQLFERFSNTFASVFRLFNFTVGSKKAVHHLLTNQNGDIDHAANHRRHQIPRMMFPALLIIMDPFFSLIGDWFVTINKEVHNQFLSRHWKTALRNCCLICSYKYTTNTYHFTSNDFFKETILICRHLISDAKTSPASPTKYLWKDRATMHISWTNEHIKFKSCNTFRHGSHHFSKQASVIAKN